ncbi:MAG: hypothetical protein HDT43_12050 [Ruminococcaceae bacterium]|nr:hypothetical protein [Oscillospiraceae bacterium]
MNKINPLFEAVTNIDDNIVSCAIKEKRRSKKFRVLLTAAAVMTFCLLTTAVSALGIFTAPKKVMINGVSVTPSYGMARMGYDVVEYYVVDVPEAFLTEEREGFTPVGEVKVIANPEYPNEHNKWIITDAAGNEFRNGINNKIITFNNAAGVGGGNFACLNFNEEYSFIQIENEEDKIEFVFLPDGLGEEYLKQELNR